jgi:predicted DNA-binding antitoxin AbrB/MazE fold protein
MTFHADAIYEGGVLRPLVPLDLKEQQVVSLAISTAGDAETTQTEAARQRKILLDYVANIERRPDGGPQDGFSNRDHDRLIYGP